MKDYLEETIASAEEYAGEVTEKAITEAKDVLSDEKFILQKGLRSLSDKDARVGNKSKTQQFYGYKAEYTMTADERIITAMDIHTGEYVDGKEFSTLLEKTVKTGQRQESFRLRLAHRFFMKKVRSKRSPSFWRNIRSVPRRNGKTAK